MSTISTEQSSSLHDVVLVGRARPGDERERLLVVEDGAQADHVVHDGLEAPDALEQHPLPLAVRQAAMGILLIMNYLSYISYYLYN